MIGRLILFAAHAFQYFCVATCLAAAILLIWLSRTWGIDGPRWLQILAAAQGIQTSSAGPAATPPAPAPVVEQVSFEQVLEARAVKYRNLELREQALRNGLDQLRFEQGRMTEQLGTFQKTRETFQQEVSQLLKRSAEGGWEENRRVLTSAKPKQAKELVMQMLENKEIEVVVSLLANMPDNRRAKLVGEFKTPDEIRKIDEILRLLRKGDPLAAAATQTQNQLNSTPAAGGASQ